MQKPEFTSAITLSKAGHDLPSELVDILLKENTSAIGMVVKEGNKLEVQKDIRLKSPAEVRKSYDNILANVKKYSTMMSWHSVQSGQYAEDEVQPWTLIKSSKGDPLLCCCVEGDFPAFVDNTGEGYSEAYCLMRDWLYPKVQDMYKTVGNNPGRVLEWLKSAQFFKDFELALGAGHRGVISFMPLNGDMFTLEKNSIGLARDWGEVSNAYSYTEPEKKQEAPAPVKTSGNKYDTPPTADPNAPKPPPIPDQTPKDPIQKVAEAMTAEVEIEEEVDYTPPANLFGEDLKKDYRRVREASGVPFAEQLKGFNWKARPTIKIKVKRKVKSSDPAAQAQTQVADKTSNVITAPILSGPQQSQANEFLKKILGDGSSAISDPINANEIEKTVAKFSELMPSMQKNIENIRRLTPTAIFALNKENTEAGSLLIIELVGVARKYWDLISDPEKMSAIIKGQASPEKVVAQPAPSAPPQPQPAPAKRAGGAAEFA